MKPNFLVSLWGGRIFYDDGDNGATYVFYDQDLNKITDTSISGLANAYYYTVSGTPTKDRWYVYDNTSHVTGGKTATDGLVENICWGYYKVYTGGRGKSIGDGKTNTNMALSKTDTSSYTDSIFKYIKACRDENLNGCNDWFILSNAEQDKLKDTGLVNWYNSTYLWSSTEDTTPVTNDDAYFWYYTLSYWGDGYKSSSDNSCFAARSF